MLSLSLATATSLATTVDRAALATRFAPGTPVLGIAVYLWVIAAMNAWLWQRKPSGYLLGGGCLRDAPGCPGMPR